MEFLNNPEPWWGATRGTPLGIVDLIENGTVPVEAAAALWWTVERGASFFVVAGPGSAGKTTLASALLSFLPEGAGLYAVDGSRDRIDLPTSDGPVYLLINELSNHMERYVHGAAARRAFELLGAGCRMIGTLHADSAAEALMVMQQDSGIPLAEATRVPLILVLRPLDSAMVLGWRLAPGAARRLVQIGHVLWQERDAAVLNVAEWDRAAERLTLCSAPGGVAALATWAGVSLELAQEGIASRAASLSDLVGSGQRTPEALDAAVEGRRRAESQQPA